MASCRTRPAHQEATTRHTYYTAFIVAHSPCSRVSPRHKRSRAKSSTTAATTRAPGLARQQQHPASTSKLPPPSSRHQLVAPRSSGNCNAPTMAPPLEMVGAHVRGRPVVVVLLAFFAVGCSGHQRFACPPPRSQDTGIKSGPCGSQSGDFGGTFTELSPGSVLSNHGCRPHLQHDGTPTLMAWQPVLRVPRAPSICREGFAQAPACTRSCPLLPALARPLPSPTLCPRRLLLNDVDVPPCWSRT